MNDRLQGQRTGSKAGAGKLRVLMYHGVSANGFRDDLTVSTQQLEQHFQYLRSRGFNAILMSELIAWQEKGTPLPPKPVLITFDDGFLNNGLYAYPLALQYGMKINLFMVPAFMKIGEYRSIPCMSAEDARSLDPAVAEIGLHSYAHSNYRDLSNAKAGADIDRCCLAMQSMDIPFQPCLAYPFGAYPKRKGYDQNRFFEMLQEKGIKMAFRIGNRLNKLPLREKFLIQRIDVRGDEPFLLFRLSLALGKKLLGLPGLIAKVFKQLEKLNARLTAILKGRQRKTEDVPVIK